MEREQAMLDLDSNVLQKYARSYDYSVPPLFDDHDLRFPRAGEVIRARGYVLLDELYQIARWKSQRRAVLVRKNSVQRVRDVTQEALALMATDPGCAVATLDRLHGVGIPTASVVLTVVDPQNFGIVDVRVWDSLRRWQPARFPEKHTSYWSVKHFLCCLEAMRELAQASSLTCREVDMALWQLDKESSKEKEHHSCSSKP